MFNKQFEKIIAGLGWQDKPALPAVDIPSVVEQLAEAGPDTVSSCVSHGLVKNSIGGVMDVGEKRAGAALRDYLEAVDFGTPGDEHGLEGSH